MRIRSIKPEFWTSEDIARLPWETRLLFIALWSYVDDNGVGRDNEKLIVASVFPLEDDPRETLASISRGLQALCDGGQITRYSVGGKRWLAIVSFAKHQKIDKPNQQRYPGPEQADKPVTCENVQLPMDPRDTLATPSRHSREIPSPGAVEQGNRGTEEKVKSVARLTSSEFDQWWSVFPRKVAKRKAQAAYVSARRRASSAEILAGAERYRDDPTRDATCHGATWLNGDRWADEDPAGTASTSLALVARPRPSTRDTAVAQVSVVFEQMRRKQQQQREGA